MPERNIFSVLRKARVLAGYIKLQDDVAKCLLEMGENKGDVERLEQIRKEKKCAWSVVEV